MTFLNAIACFLYGQSIGAISLYIYFSFIKKSNISGLEFSNYCFYRIIGLGILATLFLILDAIIKQNKILTEDETDTN